MSSESTPASHYTQNNSQQPSDIYQQQQNFGANQNAGTPIPWHGVYVAPPPSAGPFPSPGGAQVYTQPQGAFHPQSPSFGSYGNSQAGPQPFAGAQLQSPYSGGYPPQGMANGYGGYSPQTPGGPFVYPSPNSVPPFDPASHPSTPRPGSNLSQHGPYGPPSTPGSPWKQPTAPARGITNSELMRNHPELASKLLIGSEETHVNGQNLEDSNQGPLFQVNSREDVNYGIRGKRGICTFFRFAEKCRLLCLARRCYRRIRTVLLYCAIDVPFYLE